jgi:3-hydroxyisobutyrate dehydrogenase
MAPFRPAFEALGAPTAMGGPGKGIAFKIVAILLSGMNVAVLAEIFALGLKLGLEPGRLHELLMGTGGRSFALEHKIGETVLPGAYYPAPFRLDLMVKDTTIGVGEASRLGVPLPIAAIVNQMYRMASAEGWGDADSGAICELYASLAGVRISGDPRSYKRRQDSA